MGGELGGASGSIAPVKEERVVANKEDDVLIRDESFVKFERLLSRAELEGRIDGPHKCLTCGMRYLQKEEAENCCKVNP